MWLHDSAAVALYRFDGEVMSNWGRHWQATNKKIDTYTRTAPQVHQAMLHTQTTFLSVRKTDKVIHYLHSSKSSIFKFFKVFPIKFTSFTKIYPVDLTWRLRQLYPICLYQECTTFLLLPPALHLFLWITAASEFRYICFFNCFCFGSTHWAYSLLPHVCAAVFLLRRGCHSYISNYMCTAAYIFVEGCMRPQGCGLSIPSLK